MTFKSTIEDLINSLNTAIPESLKHMLDLALNGSTPLVVPLQTISSSKADIRPKSVTAKTRVSILGTISESNNENQNNPTHFSWIFQHISQIAELALRILFTNQIETCLNNEKALDELKALEKKFGMLIDYYNKEMNSYLFQKIVVSVSEDVEIKTDTALSELGEVSSENLAAKKKYNPNVGALLNDEQHSKLELILKVSIYYRNLIKKLISKNANSKSKDWLSRIRYYYEKVDETDKRVVVKVIILRIIVYIYLDLFCMFYSSIEKTQYSEVNYGFQYNSSLYKDDDSFMNESEEIEKIISFGIDAIHNRSSPLFHGKNVNIT